MLISGLIRRGCFAFWTFGLGVALKSWALGWRGLKLSSRRNWGEPRVLRLPSSQRRDRKAACSLSCDRMNLRDGPPNSGSCSLRRSVRLPWVPTSNVLDSPAIGSFTEGLEERGFSGVNPGGLDHFPGAGASRGGVKETEGLGLRPRLGAKESRGLCLCGMGLFWLSALASGSYCLGLAHFEIGGAHFPIRAGVDVGDSGGGVVGLLPVRPHPFGCVITWVTRCASV